MRRMSTQAERTSDRTNTDRASERAPVIEGPREAWTSWADQVYDGWAAALETSRQLTRSWLDLWAPALSVAEEATGILRAASGRPAARPRA